jgi:hypothetical protein
MPHEKMTSSDTTVTQGANTKLTDLMTPVESDGNLPSSPTLDQIEWVVNKSSYYPFSEATGSDIVEFRVHGTVMEAFLKGGIDSFSHTLLVDVSDKDVESIKL